MAPGILGVAFLAGLGLVVCVAVVALVWALVLRPLALVRYYAEIGLKGRPWVPGVGDFFYIMKRRDELSEAFHELYREWAENFGAVSLLYYGPSVRVYISDPSLLRDALVTHAYSLVKPRLEKLERMLGAHSLLLSEGDTHKQHRRVVASAFHFSELRRLVPLMGDCAAAGTRTWAEAICRSSSSAASGGDGWAELEVHERVTAITLDIIGRSAFATSTPAQSGGPAPYQRVADALAYVLRGSVSITMIIPGELRAEGTTGGVQLIHRLLFGF